MGSPLSSFLSELYLNHIENTYILSQKNKHSNNLLLYKRYVDDTIVFYRGNTRQLEIINKYLNQISPNLQFTLEAEKDNKLNILDLTLTKDGKNIKFSVYRKPTATDQPYIRHLTILKPIKWLLTTVWYTDSCQFQ
jgi:hypothetical protein